MTEHGGNIAINGGFAAVLSGYSTSLVGGGSRNRIEFDYDTDVD